jgi:hypothetical protein
MEADYGLTDSAFAVQRGTQFAGDEQLLVRFYNRPVQDKERTAEEGRPIFKEMVYIDIKQPGNRDWGIDAPARQRDFDRFPEHYRRFLARQEDVVIEGTPLDQWPGITASQVEEMKFLNCHTVEQMANMSDANTGKFGLATLKQKAKGYLEYAKDNAAAEAFAATKARNAELEARIAKLEAMLENPRHNPVDNVVEDAPKRRGRPPRIAEA